MSKEKPSLFGLKYSNRDFTQKEAWGKNQFNSSFPASLCAYMSSQNLDNIYLKLDTELNVIQTTISTEQVYNLAPISDQIFYAFETQFTPYQQFLIGSLPRVDLVIQEKKTGTCLQALEIKLTALPDYTTCELTEDQYGCEIVVRPDTIVYLACSIVHSFNQNIQELEQLIDNSFQTIVDWTEPQEVIPYISNMINFIDQISLKLLSTQKPFLMQPIWKTEGKSPRLADHCLDVFIWSNLAFTRLFLDLIKSEDNIKSISRPIRTLIWLVKMIYDFNLYGQINYRKIIDELSYNTKNDKAFAVNGRITHLYLKSSFLEKPRIKKSQIREIILGGGQVLLSPERRFDAIIYNSPDLFA
jgi:hypothetical protein